jgi:malonyl-CoA decarboxylase
MKQSHGLMVNYCYDLAHIEKNHEALAEKGEVVASSAVRKLQEGRNRSHLTLVSVDPALGPA